MSNKKINSYFNKCNDNRSQNKSSNAKNNKTYCRISTANSSKLHSNDDSDDGEIEIICEVKAPPKKILNNDCVDIIEDEELIRQELMVAKKSAPPPIIPLSYTQEDCSILDYDSNDEDTVFHSQTVPSEVNKEEDNGDEDDDLILLYEYKDIMAKIDGKRGNPQVKSEPKESEDDDLWLIEVANITEEQHKSKKPEETETSHTKVDNSSNNESKQIKQLSKDSTQIEKIEKEKSPLVTYATSSATSLSKKNDIEFDKLLNNDNDEDDDFRGFGQKRPRISNFSDSDDDVYQPVSLETCFEKESKESCNKANNNIKDDQKLSNYIEKAKAKPKANTTKLLASPPINVKRSRLTSSNSVEENKKETQQIVKEIAPKPREQQPNSIINPPQRTSSTIDDSEDNEDVATNKKNDENAEKQTKLSMHEITKAIIELNTNTNRTSGTNKPVKKSKIIEMCKKKKYKCRESEQLLRIKGKRTYDMTASPSSLTNTIRIAKMMRNARVHVTQQNSNSNSNNENDSIEPNEQEQSKTVSSPVAKKPVNRPFTNPQSNKPSSSTISAIKPKINSSSPPKKTSNFARPIIKNKLLKQAESTTNNNSLPQTSNASKQIPQRIGSPTLFNPTNTNSNFNVIVNNMNNNMNCVNNAHVNVPTVKSYSLPNTNRYKIEDFLKYILKWAFNWLNEQEKFNEPPPLLQNSYPLTPILEAYMSFDDYYKTMHPLLLFEIWEEITRCWREIKEGKSTNFGKAIFFLKSLEKHPYDDSLVQLTCQIIAQSNDRSPFEDDIIKLTVDVYNPNEKKSAACEAFGLVKKSIKLKNDDKRILDVVKEHLKNSVNKNSLNLYEIVVYARYRKYSTKPNTIIDIQIIGNLSSSMRRLKALINFQDVNYNLKLLNPNAFDPIFWCTVRHPINDDKLDLKAIPWNDSQKDVILQTSTIINEPKNEAKFYFIQGPPGTGKSHTITGIIQTMYKRHLINLNNNFNREIQKLKILVCSPSNGGCDELARRMKRDLVRLFPSIENKDYILVRIGRSEGIHQDCEEILIENLIRKKTLELACEKQAFKSDSIKLQYENLERDEQNLKKKIDIMKRSFSLNVLQMKELEENLENVKQKKRKFEKQMSNCNSNFSAIELKKEETRVRELILKEALVIISTLNFSGSQLLDCLKIEKNEGRSIISAIIIDEAAQCLEVDSLIPLRFGCNKVILVGDPEQLPATVLSKQAQDNGLNQSLFERIYQRFRYSDNNPIKMLYEQYRMHPDICLFPSNQFYRGKLLTNKNIAERRDAKKMKHYLMFDVSHSQEIGDINTGSICNEIEGDFVLQLTLYLSNKLQGQTVGVITPYQKQLQYLKDVFSKNNLSKIEIGTVDSFQGREKDIIILSCVRAHSASGTIGFLSHRQRLNVSLTRAKYGLYVVCNRKSLKINEEWNSCIKNAQERNLIIDVNEKSFKNFKFDNLII